MAELWRKVWVIVANSWMRLDESMYLVILIAKRAQGVELASDRPRAVDRVYFDERNFVCSTSRSILFIFPTSRGGAINYVFCCSRFVLTTSTQPDYYLCHVNRWYFFIVTSFATGQLCNSILLVYLYDRISNLSLAI